MIIQVYIYIRTTLLSCLRANRTSWIMSWKRHKLKWATFWTWGFTFLSHIRTPHQTSPNITKPCQIWVYCTQTGFCQNEMIGCLGGSFLCHKKHPKTLSTCSLTRMREASRRTSTPRSSLARWPFQLWLPKVSWKFTSLLTDLFNPIQIYSVESPLSNDSSWTWARHSTPNLNLEERNLFRLLHQPFIG